MKYAETSASASRRPVAASATTRRRGLAAIDGVMPAARRRCHRSGAVADEEVQAAVRRHQRDPTGHREVAHARPAPVRSPPRQRTPRRPAQGIRWRRQSARRRRCRPARRTSAARWAGSAPGARPRGCPGPRGPGVGGTARLSPTRTWPSAPDPAPTAAARISLKLTTPAAATEPPATSQPLRQTTARAVRITRHTARRTNAAWTMRAARSEPPLAPRTTPDRRRRAARLDTRPGRTPRQATSRPGDPGRQATSIHCRGRPSAAERVRAELRDSRTPSRSPAAARIRDFRRPPAPRARHLGGYYRGVPHAAGAPKSCLPT